MRIEDYYFENEDKFIGMEDEEIDCGIDQCSFYDSYDYSYTSSGWVMIVIDNNEVYEWDFNKDYICIGCSTYDYEEEEDEDEESLWNIEEREYYRDKL